VNLLAPRAFAFAVFTALAGGAALAEAPAPRAANAYLTQQQAADRSARVANVDYVLDFTLSGKESFSGTSTISFDLADETAPLTIDLSKAAIDALVVNGKKLAPEYNQFFITLAPQDLVKGRNTVSVSYQRPHNTNGEGLHRMVDPVDGRVYTYSQFAPADALQAFALFDQPDLKATFQLTVTAPADWQVISTMRESAVQLEPAGKRWTFPRSKKLSPYAFSLHAGPYQVWEDNSGKYPLRLFARQSVAAQVTPADWFRYTKAGLAFFDDYFGIPYQFEKYDQLLVPDLLYGAMENTAAVTFAERSYLYKAAMSGSERERLASVIMHEMAHQWFGDLVTLTWWNGLWLNESFASFMGTLATAEATEFKTAWQSFYSGGKQAAYLTDQSLATHPIEVAVPSTANAFDNIDAITYSKGAAVLKQLRHLLGEQAFRKGVHNYLVTFAYKNATLDDFIGSLGQAGGRDLSKWTRDWLYNAGVNTIAAHYKCANGKISSFTLHQSAAGADLPTLREQRVQVATFRLAGGKLVLGKNAAVTYAGATTRVPALVGSACPDLVYPNYQDWGFVKVQLDKRSFAAARTSLATVEDPLLRSMLWQSLWDGVRDGRLPLNEFTTAALAHAPAEKDYTLLGKVLAMVSGAKHYLDAMHGDAGTTRSTIAAMEEMAWDGVQSTGSDSNFQRRWFGHYIDLASSRRALDRLAAILDGKLKVDGLAVGQDLRWAMIRRLNRFAHPGSAELARAEAARDQSDSGQAAALAATVIRPDPAIKAEWLARVEDLKTTLPFSRVRVAMANLYPVEQSELSEASAEARLARLPAIDKAAGSVYLRSYGVMIPANCTPASAKRLEAAAAQYRDLSAGMQRALLTAHQEDKRCLMIRQAMTAPKA
jgi:aminopeptidase N